MCKTCFKIIKVFKAAVQSVKLHLTIIITASDSVSETLFKFYKKIKIIKCISTTFMNILNSISTLYKHLFNNSDNDKNLEELIKKKINMLLKSKH